MKNIYVIALAAILFQGCGQKKEMTVPATRPVKTTIVESRSVIRKDFSGIVEAVEYVKLAFRVSGQIISLLRDAGAKEVHMRVSAPPFLNPCYYGTDIDSRDHLIACHRTIPEIADIIGADSLGYLPTGDLCRLIGDSHFCSACFDGNYPTTVPESTQKDRFERPLSARNKGQN